MEFEFIAATLFNLGVNIIYTFLALFIGVASLLIIDKKLMPGIKIEQQLKAGNVAVAIFASTILLFVAFIIAFGMKG
ncbi:DUF350 domain-containing protein [Biformimicrobium ophioploci]|uniref:DUF350 domain-containing protein n=1 Tax=Biformimicrobium ophioploci TaxID=3036711 RepID=A0ABQ6LXA2_9GAMM|nr:DUF350 domain-containing protein [Microbulbifer sp. NKW57]GMG86671.1 hypothetical protein MNKW57_09920 [Microbulbifer sp. NKW57]